MGAGCCLDELSPTGARTMSTETNSKTQVRVDFNTDQIPSIVERIRESYGKAYSAFSGCPISLCKSLERRGESRVKFDEPIYIRPVHVQGDSVVFASEKPIIGVTRDISPHGVGFAYDELIDTDHALCEFDLFGAGMVSLLIDLRWQKQTHKRAFVAGGLIVGAVKEDHSTCA